MARATQFWGRIRGVVTIKFSPNLIPVKREKHANPAIEMSPRSGYGETRRYGSLHPSATAARKRKVNRLYFGDNLAWLRNTKEFPDASVDLVYLDKSIGILYLG